MIDKTVLLDFLGYGNQRAEVVFIGMEEGLSADPPLRQQLLERSEFPPIIDLAVSAKTHASRFFSGERPPIQSTWNTMIRILLSLEGVNAPSNDDVRYYQRDRFGRSDGLSAILELLPLPSTSIASWPYAEIFPEFQTREQYLLKQTSRRIALLQKHLEYGPKLVVAYGSGYRPYYVRMFPRIKSWTKNGIFEVGNFDKTSVILTPHFTSRQMNGNRADLIALASALV